jgi:hypothetical protein
VQLLVTIVCVAAGLLFVLAALNDIFQSAIVPRATGRVLRPSYYLWRFMWSWWPPLSWTRFPEESDRREDLLAVFAPMMLVLMLALWVVLLVFGYGLIFWGFRGGFEQDARSFGTLLYFAGSSVFTIGFGDVVARTAGPRFFSVCAGLSGISLLGTTTAFLFSIFGSFQRRETFVVTVGARAGGPPSGVNLLAIAGYSMTRDDLSRLMIDGQDWAAMVMESHLAYPVLAYFRSSHDEQSWVGTLGTMLDAATLLMTTVDGQRDGQARIFYNVGRHAAHDLTHYFRLDSGQPDVGIERREFDNACDRLESAGYKLIDRDEAWKRFSELRAAYASNLNRLARFFEIAPLSWIGDRSPIITSTPHHKNV